LERDDFSRHFFGAVAQYEAGSLVSKILLLWESSAVRLNGLPANSTQESVSALIRAHGFQISTGSVRVWKAAELYTWSAHVNVENAASSKDICSLLSSSSHPGLQAFQAPPILPTTTATRRLSCKKVALSWHKPMRLVWLNFGSEEVAWKVCNGFNEGKYMILDQTIEASTPQRSGPLSERSRGRGPGHYMASHRNSVSWTVLLKNVPVAASDSQIEHSLPPHNRPRHVELAKTNNSTDEDVITASIDSLLASVGPVVFEIIPSPQGKRVRARARFEEEGHAREAVRRLQDKPQACLSQVKLTAQLVSSSKFKISKAIYESVQKQLDAQRALCDERRVKFKVFANTVGERFVSLRIEREQAEHVKAATDAVEVVLSGLVVEESGVPLWNPAFADGATHPCLRRVQREQHIVLIRDKSKRHLRFLGPPEKYEAVCKALAAYFRDSLNKPLTIQLTNEQFVWACRGGFTSVVSALGQDTTSFDIASNPKRLVITGTHEQYQRALDIVQGQEQACPSEKGLGAPRICYTEAEDAVDTPYGHRYCLDCFANMCTSTASGDREMAIHCEGALGECGRTFTLLELQDLLSSAALEDVLEASFTQQIYPPSTRSVPLLSNTRLRQHLSRKHSA